jgi:hypothetical protein
MANCYMTGVQFPLEKAFVLNRREARDLLDTLKDRVASLQRVMDQLGPLDAQDGYADIPPARRAGLAPRKHRLVCKAVADALAPGFPEINLFMEWSLYQSQARQVIRRAARASVKPLPPPNPPDHEKNQPQS